MKKSELKQMIREILEEDLRNCSKRNGSTLVKKTKTENIHRVVQVETNEDMPNAFHKQLPTK